MADPGRVVVVAAGFGLWQGGRCLAAGKWTDVSQLRAHLTASTPPSICLIIQLKDGSEVEIQEEAPGWATLLNTLPTKLPGTPDPTIWIAALRDAKADASERTLFERRVWGR